MNINNAFPSKYIKSSDIPEEGVTVVIDRVEIEDVDGKGAHKPVVYFRKGKKGLALNVVNSKKISQICGTPDTDEWAGRPITLYQTETEYQGDTVPCVRVRAAKNGATPKVEVPQTPTPPQRSTEMGGFIDDEPPF